MAGLEATLVIGAKDQTGATISALQKTIDALGKHIEAIDKLMAATAKATKANDPFIASISSTQKALAEERTALTALGDGLESLAGPTDAASAAQAKLRGSLERTTALMVAQGNEAIRAAEKIANAQKRQTHAGGGVRGAISDNLPFLGPGILHETKEAAEAGASVQDQIAALNSAGATPEQIDKARAGFREFSKTHAGVSETDYLAAYGDARVIAPGEAYEMTTLGMRYRTAARNSGVPTSEADVSNVMRIMDELGLKTMPEREDFLDKILKSQQAFRSQISTETMLSAYRNAKQSIYDWSPEFRDKVFPTLLQSSGQQGGTEMMTALNNYIGGHMQLSELKALISAGFANNKDIGYDHNKPFVKPGAHLFEADLFKSNIFRWAEDFHAHYMKRKGATESGFDDLIAKMPRNMAGLLSFFVHNDSRILRDMDTIGLPVGMKAEDNSYLAQNPSAGLDALKTSITQFAAAVSSPPMTEIATGLQKFAQGIQSVSAAYSEFADKHPEAAKGVGAGALAAGAGVGGWLSWKLLSGVGRMFGFGGAGAAADAAAGAGAGAGLGLGSATGVGAAVIGTIAAGAAILEELGPNGPLGRFYSRATPNDFPTEGDLERSRRSRLVWHNGSFVDDPEAAHGRALSTLGSHGSDGLKVQVSGFAEVGATIRVEASSELLRIVGDAQRLSAEVTLHGGAAGRMDADAAPRRSSAFGHQ